MRRHRAFAGGIGLAAVVAFVLLSVTTGYASTAGTTAGSVTRHFPSAHSTVVGSTGFLNGTEIGYFWSAARGDSVSQTVRGPASIRKAILKVDVVSNVLSTGDEVDWDFLINGIKVGNFKVVSGQTGLVRFRTGFGKIIGPNYTILIKVTNEVPTGGGSISLAYAGAFPHTIQLFKKP